MFVREELHWFLETSYTSTLRSNFNTRAFNSRAIRSVFGHSSKSSGRILTKIGGNDSYRPPGPF